MVRYLEEAGVDVTYATSLDLHFRGSLLLRHKGILSIGHDEYWSYQMRQNIVNARSRGVNLAFFSANTAYAQVTIERTGIPGGTGTHLSLARYAGRPGDPFHTESPTYNYRETVNFGDLRPAKPEEQLLGSRYYGWPGGDSPTYSGGIVAGDLRPACFGPLWGWVCEGISPETSIAGVVGHEYNGTEQPVGTPPLQPIAGLEVLSSSRVWHRGVPQGLSEITAYRWPSGSIVFSGGTVQWSWGLDDYNASTGTQTPYGNEALKRMTKNILDRFATSPWPTEPRQTPDFNDDGNADVLLHSASNGSLEVWHMNDFDRLSADRIAYADVLPPWKIAAVADFNLDGRADLIWHNQTSGSLQIWYMSDTAFLGYRAMAPDTVLPPWAVAGVGNLAGDAHPDLLWHNQSTGQLLVWVLGEDHGAARTATLSLAPNDRNDVDPPWRVGGVGDFDADGQADILWHHQGSGQLLLWQMSGTTWLKSTPLAPGTVLPPWRVASVADFNRDGRADILWQYNDGTLFLWHMLGSTCSGLQDGLCLDPGHLAPSAVAQEWRVVPR